MVCPVQLHDSEVTTRSFLRAGSASSRRALPPLPPAPRPVGPCPPSSSASAPSLWLLGNAVRKCRHVAGSCRSL